MATRSDAKTEAYKAQEAAWSAYYKTPIGDPTRPALWSAYMKAFEAYRSAS